MVLGHKGMLGSIVKQYLESKGYVVHFLTTRYGDKYFQESIKKFNGDFIINCIGSIPQRTNDFKVNTDLPILLSNIAPCKVIHPGTDCEMDIDPYGTSKRIATEYISLYSTNTKILKTSIVGPENDTAFGLMSWLGAQTGTVQGYTKAMWNGNTTLEWAKHAEALMMNWDSYETLNILEGECLSKFDMLHLFAEFYNKTDLTIEPIELGKNKCLVGNIKTKPFKDQLIELKEFYHGSV